MAYIQKRANLSLLFRLQVFDWILDRSLRSLKGVGNKQRNYLEELKGQKAAQEADLNNLKGCTLWNTNWYELPIMKEWMSTIPNETTEATVDWNTMRNEKGNLQVPYSSVYDENNKIKVSMKDLESLRSLLAKEYTGIPTAVKEGMKDQEHVNEMKTQEQLMKEIRKNIGDSYFNWSFIDKDLRFPVEREDIALSHLLNDSFKRYVNDVKGVDGDKWNEMKNKK